jgi:hypothetical protein
MSKSIKRAIGFPVLGAVMLFLTACGLTAPRSNAGFADLESLGMADTDRVMSLSLGPAILDFAAGYLDDEPETQALLRSLDGVRIRIYEVNGDAGRVAGRIDRMSAHLQDDGWEPVMLVREEDEQAHMLLRTIEGQICGLTLLVLDGQSEAVVVNVMGELEPQQFGDVMVALDVGTPAARDVRLAPDQG